jgi:hypothetical protein
MCRPNVESKMLKIIYYRVMRLYYELALMNVGFAHPDSGYLIVAIQHHRLMEERCYGVA